MFCADESQQQRRRVDVGEHRAPGGYFTAARPHGDGASVAHHDAFCSGVAFDVCTARLEPCDERRGQRARAAFGHGPADVLTDAAQDPSEEAAQDIVGREIGMQRDAGDEPARLLGAKLFDAEAPNRQQCEARDSQRVTSRRPRQPC